MTDNSNNVVFNSSKNTDCSRAIFERSLTYRRRMGRFCSVQAMYLYDMNKKVDDRLEIKSDYLKTEEDIKKKSIELITAILFFYKNIFFSRENWDTEHNRQKKIDEKYFEETVNNVLLNIEKIDQVISSFLNEKWTLDSIDAPLRAILRCGVSEILYNKKIDTPILTSEYTNMTSYFFREKQIGFVNGIIDRIAKSYRKKNSDRK